MWLQPQAVSVILPPCWPVRIDLCVWGVSSVNIPRIALHLCEPARCLPCGSFASDYFLPAGRHNDNYLVGFQYVSSILFLVSFIPIFHLLSLALLNHLRFFLNKQLWETTETPASLWKPPPIIESYCIKAICANAVCSGLHNSCRLDFLPMRNLLFEHRPLQHLGLALHPNWFASKAEWCHWPLFVLLLLHFHLLLENSLEHACYLEVILMNCCVSSLNLSSRPSRPLIT